MTILAIFLGMVMLTHASNRQLKKELDRLKSSVKHARRPTPPPKPGKKEPTTPTTPLSTHTHVDTNTPGSSSRQVWHFFNFISTYHLEIYCNFFLFVQGGRRQYGERDLEIAVQVIMLERMPTLRDLEKITKVPKSTIERHVQAKKAVRKVGAQRHEDY